MNPSSTSEDLDSFLERWKQELNEQNVGEGTSTNAETSKSEDKIAITNSYSLSFSVENKFSAFDDDSSQEATLQEVDTKVPQNRLETDTNEYYPFKILTQFLNEAPKKKENTLRSSKKEMTPSKTYSKRKYFANNSSSLERTIKKSKDDVKESDVSEEAESKTRFLDIFIADLVRASCFFFYLLCWR